MTKTKSDKHHRRALNKLLGQGIAAVVLGAMCLTAPALLESQSAFGNMAAGLRIPGFMALGLGLVLLGIRLSIQRRARNLSAMQSGTYTRKSQYGRIAPPPYAPNGFPVASVSSRVAESTGQQP